MGYLIGPSSSSVTSSSTPLQKDFTHQQPNLSSFALDNQNSCCMSSMYIYFVVWLGLENSVAITESILYTLLLVQSKICKSKTQFSHISVCTQIILQLLRPYKTITNNSWYINNQSHECQEFFFLLFIIYLVRNFSLFVRF